MFPNSSYVSNLAVDFLLYRFFNGFDDSFNDRLG